MERRSAKDKYLTNEEPMKALIRFLLPLVIGNLFQKLYTTVDSIIVGRLVSEDALAAIGACNSLTNVFICVAIGGGIGASVIVGRDFGAEHFGSMKTSVFTALAAFLGISCLMGGFGYAASRGILELLKTPESILDMATDYLQIYFLGLPFLFIYNVLSSMFNALGKSRIPLYFLIFSSVLNVGLDLMFVAVFHMGVPGVAWGTLIAQGLSCLLSLMVFLRTIRRLEDDGHRFFDLPALGSMSRIALPSILQQSTITIGYLLVQSVINGFDTKVMAGFSAAMRAEGVCVVFMTGCSNAMSAYTAQNLGAGSKDRIPEGFKAVLKLVVIFAVIVAVVLVGFPEPIARLFLGEKCSEEALRTAVGYMHFTGCFYIFFGIKQSCDGILRGSGDTFMFTVANLINLGFRVILAMVMAPRYGVQWVWYAVPVGWFINSVISLLEFRTGKWKTSLR